MGSNGMVRFWLLALLGPLLAGIVFRLTGAEPSLLVSLALLVPAMAGPILAAVFLEGGWKGVGRDIKRSFEKPATTFSQPLLAGVLWFLATIALGSLGPTMGLTDGLATTNEEIAASLNTKMGGAEVPADQIPPFGELIAVGLISSLVVGLTINGIVAYGEEYGWRSYLWEKVEGLGRVGTIGIVGLLWGLWHVPLILLAGHNFPDHRWSGIPVMVVFAIAASWPMDELRRSSGGAIAPAIFHGFINGAGSILAIINIGDERLIPPVGLLGAVAMLAPGAALWFLNKGPNSLATHQYGS